MSFPTLSDVRFFFFIICFYSITLAGTMTTDNDNDDALPTLSAVGVFILFIILLTRTSYSDHNVMTNRIEKKLTVSFSFLFISFSFY